VNDKTMDYEPGLTLIESLLDQQEVRSCIRECGVLLEAALRRTIIQLASELEDMADKRAIQVAEEAHGHGSKSLQQPGFGQLVGVYRDAKIEKILKRVHASNIRRVRKIDWQQAIECRNAVTHEREDSGLGATSYGPDEEDLYDMCTWTKDSRTRFLFTTILYGENHHDTNTRHSIGRQSRDTHTSSIGTGRVNQYGWRSDRWLKQWFATSGVGTEGRH
jgi:hypothetical protein